MKSSTRSIQGGMAAKPLIKSMKKVGSQATISISLTSYLAFLLCVGSQPVD